jgi:hypothetical protein
MLDLYDWPLLWVWYSVHGFGTLQIYLLAGKLGLDAVKDSTHLEASHSYSTVGHLYIWALRATAICIGYISHAPRHQNLGLTLAAREYSRLLRSALVRCSAIAVCDCPKPCTRRRGTAARLGDAQCCLSVGCPVSLFLSLLAHHLCTLACLLACPGAGWSHPCCRHVGGLRGTQPVPGPATWVLMRM